MSIRYGLLALLERGPMYGYQLRSAFEESIGATWPLNIGQVYTTLGRLVRDELVESLPEHEAGQRPYRITEAGRTELVGWFETAIGRIDRPRDELTIKLALALATPGIDVDRVVHTQRAASKRALQEFVRRKIRDTRADNVSGRLVLDAMIFQTEAEIRWLDHCAESIGGSDPRPGAEQP